MSDVEPVIQTKPAASSNRSVVKVYDALVPPEQVKKYRSGPNPKTYPGLLAQTMPVFPPWSADLLPA